MDIQKKRMIYDAVFRAAQAPEFARIRQIVQAEVSTKGNVEEVVAEISRVFGDIAAEVAVARTAVVTSVR